MTPKKILSFVVDRANYGRMRPVLKRMNNSSCIDSKIVATGSFVLRRFKSPVDFMDKDGLSVDHVVQMEIEGSNNLSMTKSIGLGIIEYSNILATEDPDIVLLIGDRYEALAAAIAATYMKIPIAHIQGGEVSGSLDEYARHAISKLATYHFPATERSAHYLYLMGEPKDKIYLVGCPVGELVADTPDHVDWDTINNVLLGQKIESEQKFLLVVQHPNTSKNEEVEIIKNMLQAISNVSIQTIWLWPNIDASSDLISKELRKYREKEINTKISFATNFSPELYQSLLKNTACAIGNSSSFIRDASFSGTPVVIVGDRQIGREFSSNIIIDDGHSHIALKDNILRQLSVKRYHPSNLYGDSLAAEKIVSSLEKLSVSSDPKVLDYIYR
ncbi:UDP-N-acetylglucosamine 2-epimerase [Planktomarina temperata]|nr:UDP-N-acetylglucosamine 2-epimerase [Planktomarina temperata]MDB2459781.1 UDP-N-acetylglucosamine 2-epimerase [Planktomarina temperata]